MAPFPNLSISMTLLLIVLVLSATSNARPLPGPSSLAVRLQAGGTVQCWDSLMELRSCTGEVILFFLNGGETYLGPSCCRAIQVIEHRCWAADAMLVALGFTAEEGHVLQGYCEAASPPSAAPSPPLPPASLGPVRVV